MPPAGNDWGGSAEQALHKAEEGSEFSCEPAIGPAEYPGDPRGHPETTSHDAQTSIVPDELSAGEGL